MKSTARKIVYDEILKIEAFHLKGFFQPFPNHFHEYYVIGLIERGKRKLFCRGREYLAAEGDILLFHPGDNHACTQEDEEELDYRGLNISPNIMSVLVEENLPYSEPLPEKKGSPHTVIWRHSASTKPENFWKRAGLSQRRL